MLIACTNCIFYQDCQKAYEFQDTGEVCDRYLRDLSQTIYRNKKTNQVCTWDELSERYENNFVCFEAFAGWIDSEWEEFEPHGRL